MSFNIESIISTLAKIKFKKLFQFFTLSVFSFFTVFFLVLFFFLWRVFGSDLLKLPGMVRLFFSGAENYLNPNSGRVNFLLLGTAGEKHAGADLTDTMIFLSIDKKSADTMLISIPRDIWVASLETKINAVYHYAAVDSKETGFMALQNVFQDLFGQKLDYFIMLDFNTFSSLIDIVGGVDVLVERPFDDYQYPITGKENDDCGGDPDFACRYEYLHFDRGWQQMDGELALKYVRSRYAEGEEGTDFARSLRQQKVMMALKNRLLSFDILSSAGKWKEVYEFLKTNIIIYPQMSLIEQAGAGRLMTRFFLHQNSFRTLSLEIGEDDNPGFLSSPPVEKYGQWALEPADGSWAKIREFIEVKINGEY